MSSNTCLDFNIYNSHLLNLITQQQHLYPSYNTRKFLVPYFLIYAYLLLFLFYNNSVFPSDSDFCFQISIYSF